MNNGYYSDAGDGVWQANALAHDAYAAANGITYFVPTEDEWYKAAYWTGNGYSDYANGDDDGTAPTHGTTSGWNYENGEFGTWESGFGGVEQNGTYDMMGNVWEWIEDPVGVLRGGGYNLYDSESALRSSYRYVIYIPWGENKDLGFRPVQVVPEPIPELAEIIGGVRFLPNDILKLAVSGVSSPEYSYPESTTNLVDGIWERIPHSDDGMNLFIETNFTYSTTDGTNRFIYIQQSTNSTGFIRIQSVY